MRRLLALVVVALVFTGCSETKRQEVISRYDSGEKQIVVTYQGTGSDEKLTLRETFDVDGTLILAEDLIANTKKTLGELDPQLLTKQGLASFLSGDWYQLLAYPLALGNDQTLFNFRKFSINPDEYKVQSIDKDSHSLNETVETYKIQIENNLHVVFPFERSEPAGVVPEIVRKEWRLTIENKDFVQARAFDIYSDGIALPDPQIIHLYRDFDTAIFAATSFKDQVSPQLRRLSEQQDDLIRKYYPDWVLLRDRESKEIKAFVALLEVHRLVRTEYSTNKVKISLGLTARSYSSAEWIEILKDKIEVPLIAMQTATEIPQSGVIGVFHEETSTGGVTTLATINQKESVRESD